MRICHLILTLLSIIALEAHASNLRFKHIESANGLSNNKVNCILKDSDGFMWFGTASGLNRFDGYNIKVYRANTVDPYALTDNYIQELHQDSDGRLWVEAGDAYTIYDPAHDRFINDISHVLDSLGISGTPAQMEMAATGTWIYTEGNGGGLFRRRSGKTDKASGSLTADGRKITDIATLPDDLTAVVDDRGRISLIDTTMHIVGMAEVPWADPGRTTDVRLFADSDGLLWIFSDIGAVVYNTHSGKFDSSFLPPQATGGTLRAISQDSDGRIWLGLDNEGIIILGKDGQSQHLVNYPTDQYSLGNNSVTEIYRDNTGGMWVGTQKKGVSVHNESEFKFYLEPFHDVNCIAPASTPGKWWIGTDHDGLILWDRNSGQRSAITDPLRQGHNAPITCVEPANDGGVWIGTYTQGLKRLKDGQIRNYTMAEGLRSDNVWSLLENADGTVWVGTLGGGLQLLNPSTGHFTDFTTETSGLDSDFINSLCRSTDGKIYAGTTSGVSVIDPVTKKINTIYGQTNGKRDFASRYINQLFFDSRGLLWIGTREGLNVYDMKRDSVYDVPVLHDVPNPFILGITEDAARSIWVSVDGSLANVKVDNDFTQPGYTFDTHVYSSQDGLQDCTFNQRSLALLENGDVVVGGLYGLNLVKPGSIHYNLSRPKVIFTGLSLLDHPVEVGKEYDGRVLLPKALNHTSRIDLSYRQNSFTINFTTDNYILPEHTTYYYKLEGFNNTWIMCPPGMHHVTYTNIPPGTYRLVVRAVNNDGVEGDTESTLIIEIDPPVWGTIWAKILYVLIATGIVMLILHYVKRSERRRYANKRREENARKQEELNQLKFRFYTNVSHELRTPLTLILSPLESMLKESHSEKETKRLKTIHANASRLLYLVNQLLDFRKNEVAALTFNGSSGDVIEFLHNVFNQFGDMAEKKDIAYSFHSNVDHLDMLFDADKLSKTLANLISNAMKFTPGGGSVNVDLQLTGKMLRIKVIDTGCGVPDEEKTQVFERFYQSRETKAAEGGSGIGLNLVKEYVRLHDGDVWVSDSEGGGATFTVDIPVRNAGESKPAQTALTDSVKPEEKPQTGANSDSRPTALIVDDNHDLIDFMRDELSDSFDIITAYDGLEALETLGDRKVDIIVTDLMMPRMDGIELCRRIKSDSRTSGIPVIMVTAKQDVHSVVEGLSTGADDYITKPFNNEVLRLRMKRLVAQPSHGHTGSRPLIVPEPEPIKITSLDEQFIDKARRYVEENLSRSDLSVEELSRQLGMSRVHLYKRVLQLTGKTPIEFIRVLRLKRAAQYLRESQLNVSEIAYQVGFNNPKYFSRYFQEEFGLSPSEYRKKEGV